MKTYRVIGPHVALGAGTLLGLSLAQIDSRRHALGDITMAGDDHGTAVANQIVHFKAGEVIALGPKHVMTRFEEENLEEVHGYRVGAPDEHEEDEPRSAGVSVAAAKRAAEKTSAERAKADKAAADKAAADKAAADKAAADKAKAKA